MNDDRLFNATEMMLLYGGSFVKCLAEAYRAADSENRRKLVTAFSDYFTRYEEMFHERQGRTIMEIDRPPQTIRALLLHADDTVEWLIVPEEHRGKFVERFRDTGRRDVRSGMPIWDKVTFWWRTAYTRKEDGRVVFDVFEEGDVTPAKIDTQAPLDGGLLGRT